MPQPSMILTVPTPIVPHSPVFTPHSPITVSKFFEALDQESRMADTTPDASLGQYESSFGRRPPSLVSCGDCGFFEFELGLQCRECDRRWLACKVWYRAQDGGRKRWLAAPYIRPGESNAHNRALMHGLGVPGCADGPDEVVAAICTDPGSPSARRAYAWSKVRQMKRFVEAKAVRAKGLLHPKMHYPVARKGDVGLYAGNALRFARRTLKKVGGGLGLGYLYSKLADTWRSRVYDKSNETYDDLATVQEYGIAVAM